MKGARVENAAIVVDLRNSRCDQCKVALHDELATECPVCGAWFDAIVSNHVGLAARLQSKREANKAKPLMQFRL